MAELVFTPEDLVGGVTVDQIVTAMEGKTAGDLRRIFRYRRRAGQYWSRSMPVNQVHLRAYLVGDSADRHLREFEWAEKAGTAKALSGACWRKYTSWPTRDIVETCGALNAGLFGSEDIEEMYFGMIDRPFKHGEFNWAVTRYELPIHIFTREGIANAICETMEDVNTDYEHPAFTFYCDLSDSVAFENLTRYLIQQGITQSEFRQMVHAKDRFEIWQLDCMRRVLERELTKPRFRWSDKSHS